MKLTLSTIILLLLSTLSIAQEYFMVRGYVTDLDATPLVGVYVRVANEGTGTVTNEKGQYDLKLKKGMHRISFTHVGYSTKFLDQVIDKATVLNISLTASQNNLEEVELSNKKKDLSYMIMAKVIANRDQYKGQYKTKKRHIYVKSVEENISSKNNDEDNEKDKDPFKNDSIPNLNLFEGDFIQHVRYPSGFKEEKLAAKKLGDQSSLFFTSTTDADFDLRNNLIRSKKLGENSYISPLSTTANLAYKYKLLGSRFVDRQKVYTIKVIPRKLGNALFKGELEIWDSSFAIKSATLALSKNSMVVYDKFSLHQEYIFTNNKYVKKEESFDWVIKMNKLKTKGYCIVQYSDYSFDSIYPKRFFNAELGTTSEDAYEKDTSFWAKIRSIPLSKDENQFIQYQDSIERIRNSTWYLDSIDSAFNRITILKALWSGMGHINREKKTLWNFDPAISLIDPAAIGGFRIKYSVGYYKKLENRKTWSVSTYFTYGFRNQDLKGNISINHLYNPKKRSSFSVNIGKYFGFVNQFATIKDIFHRSNFFEQNHLYVYHRTELINGLYLTNGIQNIYRQDLGDFKFNPAFDTLFENNIPASFDNHSAAELVMGIEYTPKQLYIQEPKEKVILGSKYPTFSLVYSQAVEGFFGSTTKYKFLELSARQKFNIGIVGTSEYSVRAGSFLDTSKLRLMDYRYMRGGDPFLFIPPMYGYQLIDSTFPVFNGFLEGHYVHQFNGFVASKIPGFKFLGLKTMAGGGILFVPERKYQYAEMFTGLNRIVKIGKERLRLGVYYVVAQSNTQGFTSGFKISFEPYNSETNTWSF